MAASPSSPSSLSRAFSWAVVPTIVACAIIVADQVTKALATALLASRDYQIWGPISLSLVYDPGNTASHAPAPAWEILVIHLPFALLLLLLAYALKDLTSRICIGLMLGGMISNAASLLVPPHLVADSLAVSSWQVFDLGDFAIIAGALMLLARIAYIIVKQRIGVRSLGRLFMEPV